MYLATWEKVMFNVWKVDKVSKVWKEGIMEYAPKGPLSQGEAFGPGE